MNVFMTEEKDNQFNFDLERMKQAVAGPSIRIPMGLSREERRAYISEALDIIDAKECPKCGCSGIHACMGQRVVWTEEDKARLDAALRQVFKEENRSIE